MHPLKPIKTSFKILELSRFLNLLQYYYYFIIIIIIVLMLVTINT